MSEYKNVYLIVQHGAEPNRQTFWRPAGVAYVCRDGSLNLKLDFHPGLVFNIRDPKSNGERDEANGAYADRKTAESSGPTTINDGKREVSDDDIPF